MYLKNMKLWNFRKFGIETEFDISKPHLDLNFKKGLNLLIGENDSGKTAIVDAIKIVLKTHSYEWVAVDDEDFFKDSTRLRIELLFDDMENEAYHFTEWLGFNGTGPTATPFLKVNYDVTRKNGKIFPADIRAGADPQGAALNAGAKEYLKTTYLKPLRDANLDLTPKKNSRLSQIFHAHEAFESRENHLLVSKFKDLNDTISNYFSGKDLSDVELQDVKGKALKDSIDNYVQSFIDPDFSSLIKVTPANLKAILERLMLQMDGHLNPGLGTMNKLFIATELLHLEKQNWSGLRLGLIEEIEAHLHPQAQMKVIESLKRDKNIQLILTTHSPNLASKVELENIIICNNGAAYPLGREYTHLDSDDYKFLERFLDVTKANMFFARGIIMVEGWTEEILLPAIARRMKSQGMIKKNLTDAGVSIVNVGHTEFLRYSKIFLRQHGNELPVPVSIVTDSDIPCFQRVKKSSGMQKAQYDYNEIDVTLIETETKAKIAKLSETFNEQRVKSFVTCDWTLEFSLLRSTSLRETVQTILTSMYPSIDKLNLERALAKKLLSKKFSKTEFAYKLANKIDPDSAEFDSSISLLPDDKGVTSLIEAIKYACN